jgi:hypothetical protein
MSTCSERLLSDADCSTDTGTGMTKIPHRLKQAVSNHADIWAAVALVVLALLVFHPTLATGLILVDDHELIRLASPVSVHPQAAAGPPSVADVIVHDFQDTGRFRPLYYLVRLGLVCIFGTNPLVWHAFVLFLGICTALLLYHTGRALRVAPPLAFAFAVLFLYAPSAAYTWIRIGPQESIGTFLTGLALFAVAQAVSRAKPGWCDFLFVISASAAALTKESFILVLPAILYARIALECIIRHRSWRQSISANSGVLVALSLVFVFGLTLTALAAKMGGAASYGGSSLVASVDYFVGLGKSVLNTLWEGGLLGAVFLFFISAWYRRSLQGERRYILHAIIFCGLWIAPQLLLYSTRGGITGFYLLPAVIGLAAANVMALLALYRQRSKAYSVGLIWLVVWLTLAGAQVYARASKIQADSVALNRMLDFLAANVGPGKTVVVAADPIENYESTLSLVYHIGYRHRNDIPIALLSSHNTSPHNPFESTLKNTLETTFSEHNAQSVSPEQIDAVILFTPISLLPEAWYSKLKPSAQLIEFSETAFLPGISSAGIRLFNLQSYAILRIQH